MEQAPGIVITGASGRMGQMLIREVLASDTARLIGAVDRPGHDWIGKDLGVAMGGASMGVTVTDDPLEAFANAQAIIDFTSPDASVAHADIAAQARAVHVIGTTGFAPEHLERLDAAARHATIIRAGHMNATKTNPGAHSNSVGIRSILNRNSGKASSNSTNRLTK